MGKGMEKVPLMVVGRGFWALVSMAMVIAVGTLFVLGVTDLWHNYVLGLPAEDKFKMAVWALAYGPTVLAAVLAAVAVALVWRNRGDD
jgi:biotin transporter BioY